MFFLGFIILFFLVFALGVIVGKGLNTEDLIQIRKQEKKSDQLLASSSVNIINNKDELEPKNVPVKKEVKPEIVPEIKKIPVKKVVKKDAPTEKTVEKKSVKPEEKKEIKTEKTKESVKEDKYVTKFDYNKPDFPNTDQGGKYTVQLGSFQNIDAAYNLEKKMQAKGYPSFVIKAAIPKKGTWYRVRVGTFQNKEKAVAYAEKLKSIEKLEYTQVTLNN